MINPNPYVYQMPDKKQQSIDQTNRSCYDQCAATWDRFPFPQVLPSFVEKHYRPSLGNKVLDVGSGTGLLPLWLTGQGLDVLCIDPSPEMVRRCLDKGLKTEQYTIQEFEPRTKFAMIFAILSLIHVPKDDFPLQIEKLADAMPNEGILFLGMLEGQGEGFFEGPKYPRFFAYYTKQEILKIVQPYFEEVDYDYVNNEGTGYMFFALKKLGK